MLNADRQSVDRRFASFSEFMALDIFQLAMRRLREESGG